MRPIRRPAEPDMGPAVYDVDRLTDAIGPFCSLCERPLHDRIALWDAAADALVERVDPAAWSGLLLLCVNCADWQRRTAGSSAALLLPDRATTFRVAGESPYSYDLEPVTRRIVGEEGEAEEVAETEVAVVRGATPAARDTVDRFRLNTPYYDAEARTLTIPRADYLSGVDRRLDLRTAAWRMAEQVLPRLLGLARMPGQEAAVDGVQRFVEQTGFWSVWATLLRRETREPALLERALAGGPRDFRAASRPGGPPRGPRTLLRGTSPSFLD